MSGRGRIELVLLDIDDTLLPTTSTFWGALEEVLRARYPNDADEALQTVLRLVNFFGTNEYRGFLQGLCAERGLTGSALQAEHTGLCQAYKAAYARRIAPRPGSRAVLRRLAREGRQLGVVSNGRPGFQRMKLERSGLGGLFRGPILVSGDYPPSFAKPAPGLFLEALRQTGLRPDQVAFVGDRTADVIGANLAGLWSIRYWAPEQAQAPVALRLAQPDASLRGLDELEGVIAALESTGAAKPL